MAMYIRPDPQLAEDLRQLAEDTGCPQSMIVLDATREYIERYRRSERLRQIAGDVVARHSGLLTRLGEA